MRLWSTGNATLRDLQIEGPVKEKSLFLPSPLPLPYTFIVWE